MYAVEVEKLTKIYGKGNTAVTAIADASFRVEPGELVAILGPSGSGKTTLLTSIGLITEPTHGKVVIDGVTVADEGWQPGLDLKRVRREKLGFIFQAHNLIPFLTALENVMVALELNHQPKKEAKRRAEELLVSLNLGHRFNNYPSGLSGGEAQRVAIARALANRPKVILADEPTAALDTENGKNVMSLLKKLAVENHSAIMVVTHDHRMVEGFDRIFHVNDGRIVL
ncbi:ABC-type antimicrobial peptide transport system, ATPase component [Citrifermentans bremense]|uniref:ABC transporter n=2 Tax=Geobacteraceae TaxID=213422 RepID=A0ABQ0MKP9_9BACT|nr:MULTISPECIES: ABC transporter ATP-binding protein [Geobacteraceae]BCG46033.1 ABC-type antimicrobial peptide transport system, ATPase component [Citrifermentans bremense]GAW67514.1 ABC transporter [Geoanaerobacter pelophilus]